jgi:hypothetical protein
LTTERPTLATTQHWLDDVVAIEDPESANRAITRAHFALSEMLAEVLGPDSGANFHTWAVWGSREAGTTISRRDVPGLRAAIGGVSALIGFMGGMVLGDVVAAVTIGVTLGLAAGLLTQIELDRARRHISHGNRIVLEEIGGATLRFVSAFGDDAETEAMTAFLDGLEPGPTEDGGQELLRSAFGAYHAASHEEDRERRHQLVFAANCFAVWHEHIRLQRDIARAMPWPFRRIITRALLDFVVGPEHLHVGHDLAPVDGAVWPPTLRVVREPLARTAVAALRAHDRQPDSLAGSAASSWAALSQRMNYVVDLFRSHHLADSVFDPPYPEACRSGSGSWIDADSVPGAAGGAVYIGERT